MQWLLPPCRPPRQARSLWLLCNALVAALLLSAVPVAQAQTVASEYKVKAAYLYNFAKFIHWPDSAFKAADTPIRLCFSGADPVGSALDDVLKDRWIDQRAIIPVRISGPTAQLRNCQIIYHSPRSNISGWELIRMVQDYPVLTIGEGSDFLDLGGVIGFIDIDNRIKFDVNLPASNRAGVTLSSRLLGIARQVRQH